MPLPPLDNLVRIGKLKAEALVRATRTVAERVVALGPVPEG
jgi:hypothetical protein